MDFLATQAMSFIRSFFNSSIEHFNQQDLKKAIRDNVDLWGASPPAILSHASWLNKLFGRLLPRYFDQITTDMMLNSWLSIDRPDLALTIKKTPGGYDWFDKQVKNIKGKILNM